MGIKTRQMTQILTLYIFMMFTLSIISKNTPKIQFNRIKIPPFKKVRYKRKTNPFSDPQNRKKMKKKFFTKKILLQKFFLQFF